MATTYIQHLNICIYEIAIDKDGENHHLMKQVNNPIPCVDVNTRRVQMTSFDTLKEDFLDRVQDKDNAKAFKMYPDIGDTTDQPKNWTVVEGIMVEYRRLTEGEQIDTLMVTPNATKEEMEQAKMKAIAKHQFYIPFMIAVPETDKFMFDIAISHIAPKAITQYKEVSAEQIRNKENDTAESLPLGLDPRGQFISEEDLKKLNSIRDAMAIQIDEAMKANDAGTLPEDFQIDNDRLFKDSGFTSEAEYLKFRSYFEVPAELLKGKAEDEPIQ